ncbi:Electron transfer flavoprotein-ubiquinone oxidoreductase [Candidatus Bealeia paramacronuclearis]|uniref:Electron transfer flavoprotein-ubiquinone oxidoreductase n=1 Tax=Candidatus Bealeia paramacronuclearis TaxID=1921001 RepID=A0ABZ2C795_9PROT|nr:Electron transfer flavoprotein-ubiquinone oxidoreductase [Candidatus Bealeia paramacronuclearis]
MSDESMHYDVVIVGAGPAGLSAAIRLKQLSPDLSVCILEKASVVGSQILSGCVFEPRALDELIPNWREKGAPLLTPVTHDRFLFLTKKNAIPLLTPPQMNNTGNYIISLENFTKWLGTEAESLGVEIYPGFAAVSPLIDKSGSLIGIETGAMGLDKMGEPTDLYQAGVKIYGKLTLLAEGCRGSLSKQLEKQFNLRNEAMPQTYGLGIKEIWEIDPAHHREGEVLHTIGWPLQTNTYGGSFLYHMSNSMIAVGFVVGLDYPNPYLSPFEEFQRFKLHPKIRGVFEGAKRLSYGARALNEGGFQSIPALTFPGGAVIGCAAGFLNVPKIKGSHTAMKSGMVAAEAAFEHLTKGSEFNYKDRLQKSWVWKELYQVRNIRPGFQKGLWVGLLNAAFETFITRGKSPWTLKHRADFKTTKFAEYFQKIDYPKPDNQITFDRLSSVYLSNISHDENQPCHLTLRDPERMMLVNYREYGSPETRYCPAGVYEIVKEEGRPKLQINSQNCIHCKTCDIKDPTQNINWVPPQGGSGPNYCDM